jgi:hypothetical protein
MQAAIGVLKDAVAQFGPGIIAALQQVLEGAGEVEPPAELGGKFMSGGGEGM